MRVTANLATGWQSGGLRRRREPRAAALHRRLQVLARRRDDTPEKFMAYARSRMSPAEHADLWLLANGFLTERTGPFLPLDPDELDGLL
jgi:hypothetical protein